MALIATRFSLPRLEFAAKGRAIFKPKLGYLGVQNGVFSPSCIYRKRYRGPCDI